MEISLVILCMNINFRQNDQKKYLRNNLTFWEILYTYLLSGVLGSDDRIDIKLNIQLA